MKKTLLSVMVALSVSGAKAQWVSNGPYAGYTVNCLAVSDSAIFAGTVDGLFYSIDNGNSWSMLNSNLPGNLDVTAIGVKGPYILVGSYEGLFLSYNSGTDWVLANSSSLGYSVSGFAFSRSNIFATSGAGVFLSTDTGNNWTALTSGLPVSVPFTSICVSGSYIYAGAQGDGVYLSMDNGGSWTKADSGIYDDFINTLTVIGPNVFAGTEDGLFVSSNNAGAWREVDPGIYVVVTSVTVVGSYLFAGTNGGVCTPPVNDVSGWNQYGTDLTDQAVLCLATIGPYIFAGTNGGGVFELSLPDSVLGVQEINAPEPVQFKIYPNPSSVGSVQLAVSSDLIGSKLEIFDTEGRVVFQSPIRDLQSEINLDVASGIYIAMLKSATGLQTQKLVVER